MIEIDATQFEAEVIQASRTTPVLVDFWAPWCGPCQVLGPILEQLEQSFQGRFRLVKVNSDDSQGIAAAYGVRGIPNVIAFVDGEAVDRFVGALPESQVRAFLERVLPDAAEQQRRRAMELIAQGQLDSASAALRSAIQLAADKDSARLDLAELLLERMPGEVSPQRLSEAEQTLSAVNRAAREQPRSQALLMRLTSLQRASSLAPTPELVARVTANPADLEARWDLAQHYIAQRSPEPAVEQLLEIVDRARGERRESARLQILAALQLMADQPQLVSGYRRRLSLLLHR